MSVRDVDAAFMHDVRQAVLRPPRLTASLILFSIVAMIGGFFYWAHTAPIEQVTSGQGTVIPSRQVQVVQSLEGGIITQILVRGGDRVAEGQALLHIDDKQILSAFQESRANQLALLAQINRLRAEIAGGDVAFPDEVMQEAPDIAADELALLEARRREHESTLAVLGQQRVQRRQEIQELRTRAEQARETKRLIDEEIRMLEPIVERGATSRVNLLRLQREASQLQGTVSSAELAIPRAQAALEEVEQRVAETNARFRSRAQEELNKATVEYRALSEVMTGERDRIRRTVLASPVDGVVKQLRVTTVGQVVRPAEPLIEIVPSDDSLLIEARIRPADIAFLRPDLPARVRFTAYDFTRYGGLDAQLETIGADTVVDENGESFYEVAVRTEGHLQDRDGEPLPIIPGMIAQVDILTGERTVLEYLLSPVLRARYTALRER